MTHKIRTLQDKKTDKFYIDNLTYAIKQLLDLLTAVEQAPLPMNDGSELSESDLVTTLRFVADGDKEGSAYLPRLVDELERGETALYTRLVERRNAPKFGLGGAIDVFNSDAKDFIIKDWFNVTMRSVLTQLSLGN